MAEHRLAAIGTADPGSEVARFRRPRLGAVARKNPQLGFQVSFVPAEPPDERAVLAEHKNLMQVAVGHIHQPGDRIDRDVHGIQEQALAAERAHECSRRIEHHHSLATLVRYVDVVAIIAPEAERLDEASRTAASKLARRLHCWIKHHDSALQPVGDVQPVPRIHEDVVRPLHVANRRPRARQDLPEAREARGPLADIQLGRQ